MTQELVSVIRLAVDQIESNENSREQLAKALLPLKTEDLSQINSSEMLEKKLVSRVWPSPLNLRVGGSDSGFVSRSLHSIDLVLVRAVGVLFEYQNHRLQSAAYWPNFFDFPKPFLSNRALDLHEIGVSASLVRLREEIGLAKQIIAEQKPDFFLMDGSLIPQYADKPAGESELYSAYHETIDDFLELYRVANQNKTELVGCVEDSRGKRFGSILSKTILPALEKTVPQGLDFISDSVLLDHVLEQNERSFAFLYTQSIRGHPVLNDFAEKKWGNHLMACYVKPSALDRPLRFEFLHSDETETVAEHANRVASQLVSLSSFHREYAYPSVLIEADLRSRLRPDEVELMCNKITDKLRRRVRMPLRRNARPF